MLASAKETKEHRYAAESVSQALAPLCADLIADVTPSVIRLADTHHLATTIRGTLAVEAPALKLAGLLHPTAAVCGTPPAAAQLALSYRGGGFGTGNDFGVIIFRDTGTVPCRLAGPVRVTGLNAAGHTVTSTAASAFTDPGVLSPHAAPVPDFTAPPPGELVYGWTLAAEYRDGPPSVHP